MRWLKRKLLNYILRDLFNAIVEDDLDAWQDLTEEERRTLVVEADVIVKSVYWNRLVKSVKLKAQELMFSKSQSWEDLYFGKAALYVVDLLDKRLKAVSKKLSD